MLDENQDIITQSTKKHVYWADSVVGNEKPQGIGVSKEKQKGSHHQHDTRVMLGLITKIKNLAESHFLNGTYKELEEELNQYPETNRIEALSSENGSLFINAALESNVEALGFILRNVPAETALDMLHYNNLSALRLFLAHEHTLEMFEKVDHIKRVAGLKIFLSMDAEPVKVIFNNFCDKLSKEDAICTSLKNDMTAAMARD